VRLCPVPELLAIQVAPPSSIALLPGASIASRQGWRALKVEGGPMFCCGVVASFRWRRIAAHVRVGEFIFATARKRASRPAFVYRRGWQFGPEVVGSGQRERGQNAGQVVNVGSRGRSCACPRGASKPVQRGDGRQPTSSAMLGLFGQQQYRWLGLGSGCVELCFASRCAGFASQAVHGQLNSRSTSAAGVPFWRSRCNTFTLQIYSVAGEGCRVVKHPQGAVWPQGWG